MKVLRTLCLGFLSFFTGHIVQGQEVIGAGGNSAVIDQNSINWTIGETVVGMRSVGNNNVTQGFQQPEIKIVSVNEEKMNQDLSISIFPNPTTNVVNIQPKNFGSEEFTLQLLSLNGQKIKEETFSNEGIILDVTDLESANYLLIILNEKENYYHNFKLIKSH